VDALQDLIRWAWDERIALIPRGGGTGMPGGNLGPYLTVELGSLFDAWEWIDRRAGRLRLGAGVIGYEAERIAGEAGFAVPFMPSSRRWCRLGGMVANNAAGPRSFRHGSIAPFVERLEGVFSWGDRFRIGPEEPVPGIFSTLRRSLEQHFENGSAERSGPDAGRFPGQIQEWPRVRKNSSGYALDRYLPGGDPAQILVGSEGSLAFVTQVDLRLPGAPQAQALALVATRSHEELTELALDAQGLQTETCEFLGRRFLELSGLGSDPELGAVLAGASAAVLLEVAGTEREVDAGLSSIRTLASRLGSRSLLAQTREGIERLWGVRHAASPMIAEAAREGRVSTQFIEDSVVPPEAVGAYLVGLEEILEEGGLDAVIFGHAGDGNVHVNPFVDVSDPHWKPRVRATLEAVVELVSSLGGTLSGEHGDGRLRAPFLERIWTPRLVTGFKMVKDALDPRGVLNPGVVLPVWGQDPLAGFEPKPPHGLHGRPEDASVPSYERPRS
jgi:FAD/FMN-containing dehydrogenase